MTDAQTEPRRLRFTSLPAACEACRRLKMRCTRAEYTGDGDASSRPCDRCARSNRVCNIPPPQPLGRKPGSLGRHRGLGKGGRKSRTAVRKPMRSANSDRQSSASSASGAETTADNTDCPRSPSMAVPATPCDDANHILPVHGEVMASTQPVLYPQSGHTALHTVALSPFAPGVASYSGATNTDAAHRTTDHTVSDPMGLLTDAEGQAHADDEEKADGEPCTPSSQATLPSRRVASTPIFTPRHPDTASSLLSRPGYVSLGLNVDRRTLERALDSLSSKPSVSMHHAHYFKAPRVNDSLDVGPDLDPVDQELISIPEVHHLFSIYTQRLHPLHGILDPALHTPEFVRTRSALLFTWILVISAQFDHASAAIAKRLRLHGEKLSKHVHAQGFKSVEIVQGYYISLLSAVPTTSLVEERSWMYTAHAFGMASALGLDRLPPPSLPDKPRPQSNAGSAAFVDHQGTHAPSQQAAISVISPTGSHGSYKPSEMEQRLARNRERTWLRIALWEQAHNAACGRVRPSPENDLMSSIEEWWQHPLANEADAYTCAFVLLRRLLAALHHDLSLQPNSQSEQQNHHVRDIIDSILESWRSRWLLESTPPLSASVGPRDVYLRYVFYHGRLLTLCFALGARIGRQAQAAHVEITKQDCFEAAVHCCEMAVRDLREIGEPMYCMLAPTWFMVSFGAMLALKLFPQLFGDRPGQEIELLALLAELAMQLEKAGTIPHHRLGIAALLGQHLSRILRGRLAALRPQATVTTEQVPAPTQTSMETATGYMTDWMAPPGQPQETTLPLYPLEMAAPLSLSPTGEILAQAAFSDFMQEWYGQGSDSIFDSVANVF
ncbi:hypothetical protein CC79DRAFT_421122 [Sarocladium strictum]